VTKSRIFFILSLAFLAGIFFASFFQIEKYIVLALAAAGILIFTINYRNKKIIVASAAVIFLALGIWRTNFSLENSKKRLANQELGPVELTGIVLKEPEISETNQKIVVGIEDEKQYSNTVYCTNNLCGEKKRILITAPLYPQYSYGDELKIKCSLEEPKNYADSKFDYQMYLAKDRIYRICNKAQITVVSKNKGNKLYTFILAVKNKFEEKLSAIFPDPEGAYLKGLLLGGSKRMAWPLAPAGFFFRGDRDSVIRPYDGRAQFGRESGDYGRPCHLGDERGETGQFNERHIACGRRHARDQSFAFAI